MRTTSHRTFFFRAPSRSLETHFLRDGTVWKRILMMCQFGRFGERATLRHISISLSFEIELTTASKKALVYLYLEMA